MRWSSRPVLFAGASIVLVAIVAALVSGEQVQEFTPVAVVPPSPSEQPRDAAPAAALPAAKPSEAIPPSSASPQPVRRSLEQGLMALEPPNRPAWEMVQALRRIAAPTPSQENEVFAALSYCVNSAGAADTLRSMRAEGRTTDPSFPGLEKVAKESEAACARLGPGDYEVRSAIAKRRADAGDVDGMLTFFEIGPSGAGGGPMGLSAEVQQTWLRQAEAHLEAAVSRGSLEAISTLGAIYRASPDPVKAYAYALAYASARADDPTLTKPAKDAIAAGAVRLRKDLTATQRRDAETEAKDILRKCCKK